MRLAVLVSRWRAGGGRDADGGGAVMHVVGTGLGGEAAGDGQERVAGGQERWLLPAPRDVPERLCHLAAVLAAANEASWSRLANPRPHHPAPCAFPA